MVIWLSNLRNRSVVFRAAVLGIVVLVAFAMIGPVAVRLGGSVALAAASLAAALCLTGATVALVVGNFLRGPRHALAALAAGMAVRMGVPLAPALAIHLQGGPLAEAGLLYYLLVFYPVTLAVETALSLPESRRPTPPRQASSNAAP